MLVRWVSRLVRRTPRLQDRPIHHRLLMGVRILLSPAPRYLQPRVIRVMRLPIFHRRSRPARLSPAGIVTQGTQVVGWATHLRSLVLRSQRSLVVLMRLVEEGMQLPRVHLRRMDLRMGSLDLEDIPRRRMASRMRMRRRPCSSRARLVGGEEMSECR